MGLGPFRGPRRSVRPAKGKGTTSALAAGYPSTGRHALYLGLFVRRARGRRVYQSPRRHAPNAPGPDRFQRTPQTPSSVKKSRRAKLPSSPTTPQCSPESPQCGPLWPVISNAWRLLTLRWSTTRTPYTWSIPKTTIQSYPKCVQLLSYLWTWRLTGKIPVRGKYSVSELLTRLVGVAQFELTTAGSSICLAEIRWSDRILSCMICGGCTTMVLPSPKRLGWWTLDSSESCLIQILRTTSITLPRNSQTPHFVVIGKQGRTIEITSSKSHVWMSMQPSEFSTANFVRWMSEDSEASRIATLSRYLESLSISDDKDFRSTRMN